MGYDADSITTLRAVNLRVPWSLVSRAKTREIRFDTPDRHFLDVKRPWDLPDDVKFCELEHLSWCGEGSGSTWKTFLALLEQTRGTFEGYVTWERGDCVTGLRVVDGVVTEPAIVISLEAPTEKPGVVTSV
mgnify:FL=1